MPADRHLDWDGCRNVRDLGGLRAAGGRVTRRGAMVRGDAPDRLTPAGWAALRAYGIRTIVDLRNDDERGSDAALRPPELSTVALPLDGVEDTEFWDVWGGGPEFCTPVYYAPFLERFPQRTARVVAAIAHATPGGVLFHCVGGRDRSGLIAMLLLALAGVSAEDIAADYELSAGRVDLDPEVHAFLARRGTTERRLVLSTLASIDVEAHLRAGGLDCGDLAAIRARLF